MKYVVEFVFLWLQFFYLNVINTILVVHCKVTVLNGLCGNDTFKNFEKKEKHDINILSI